MKNQTLFHAAEGATSSKGTRSGQFGEPWVVAIDSYGVERIWNRDEDDVACCEGDGSIPTAQRKLNASRIASCVNACAGLTDEQLKRVRAVNEMYESCSKFVAWAEDNRDMVLGMGIKNLHEFILMKAALALADGREPQRGSHE